MDGTFASKRFHASTLLRRATRVKRDIASEISLESLEQGPLYDADIDIEGCEKVADVNKTEVSYSSVLLNEVQKNIRKYPNCVILTRVGSFYELYFHQAEELAHLLNIRLAKRHTSKGSVPMAGFPFMHLDRYLKILVQDLHKYVAVCEEYPNPNAKKSVREQALAKTALYNLETETENKIVNTPNRLRTSNNMFIRKVSRIITPGTLIDENFLNPVENNFLLTVSLRPIDAKIKGNTTATDDPEDSYVIGLSWLDFSTGDFYCQMSTIATLTSDLARISPSEILLDKLEDLQVRKIYKAIEELQYFISYQSFEDPILARKSNVSERQRQKIDSPDDNYYLYRSEFINTWKTMFDKAEMTLDDIRSLEYDEIRSASIMLNYVREKLPDTQIKLQVPVRRNVVENMLVDANSLRALEIKKTLRDQHTSGSLLNTIRRTVTKSGTRLLSDWITSPLTSISAITERHNLVELLVNDADIHAHIENHLKNMHDLHRVVQKFALARGDAEDIISLQQSLESVSSLRRILRKYLTKFSDSVTPEIGSLKRIENRLVDLGDLEILIVSTFDQDQIIAKITQDQERQAQEVIEIEDGNPIIKKSKRKQSTVRKGAPIDSIDIIKRDATTKLKRLHAKLEQLLDSREIMESSLRKELGSPQLELRWAAGTGFYVAIPPRDVEKFKSIDTEYGNIGSQCLATKKSSCYYYMQSWTVLGNEIDSLKILIRMEEKKIFNDTRIKIVAETSRLRNNARVIDELDVVCSFATLARERKLVRPKLHSGLSYSIIAGRHTTVELGLEKKGVMFTPNDCFLGEQERLWLITGPNMGGKSTFLRQNAIICILAQAGAFVPAEYAEIGIVDQIFSRVGSADNLYRDESTFMVEMLETAHILRQATARSFVIMDEIGRGTTPLEGIAIAYGCLYHLHQVNKSRTLFATHFHDLAEMIADLPATSCYCTELVGDEITGLYFQHRLRRGVNRRSHGLHVAKLAGIPSDVIEVAVGALHELERSQFRQIQDNLNDESFDAKKMYVAE
ncbi:muts domain V-domain-containing protein [Dipodascopsis uninucleata]